MAEVGSVFVSVVPSMKGFGQSVAAEGNAAGSRFSSGFKLAALAGVATAAAAVGKFIGDSVGEAREAQKVAATTAQIIKSTGGAANLTASAVGRLSEALSRKTGIDDEAIQTGSNLLLTFKNVQNQAGAGNKIFNQATAAALDLSAAGFGSIESASVMLGKALNDPMKGMTALGRAGVTFTAAQKQQVEQMVKAGDLLGAQKVILGEVKAQVGGVAAATATSTAKMGVAWGNFKETIGAALLPAIDAVVNAITPLIVKLTSSKPALIAVGVIVGGVLVGAFLALAVAVIAATWPFILIGVAVAAVVAALIFAWTHFETFRTIVTAVFNVVVAVVRSQIAAIVMVITTGVKVAVAVFNFFKDIPKIVSDAWNAVKSATTTAWNATLSFIQALPGKIVAFFKALPGQLRQVGADAIQGLIDGFNPAKLLAKAGEIAQQITDTIRGALDSHSPSRVMMAVGADVAAGLAVGMDRSSGMVEAAANRLTPNVSAGRVHSSVGVTPTTSSTAGRRYALTITNWQDGTGYISDVADGAISRQLVATA